MLDVQRERHQARKQEITFTRRLLIAHIGFGWMVPTLLLFHQLFFLSAAATLWLLVTLGLITGVMTAQEWCRTALGLLFTALALTGIYVVTYYAPTIPENHKALLSIRWLPLWGGFANIAYLLAGFVILASSKVKKAVGIGFTLW